MSTDEHLELCKKRALEYLDRGDISNAIASMGSDLAVNKSLMSLGLLYVMKGDLAGARRWIEGFR